MRYPLIIAAVVMIGGIASAQPKPVAQSASPKPDFVFKTWQDVVDNAPCSAFQGGNSQWTLLATIELTENDPSPRINSSGHTTTHENPPEISGIYAHETFVESPIFAPLDQRCGD